MQAVWNETQSGMVVTVVGVVLVCVGVHMVLRTCTTLSLLPLQLRNTRKTGLPLLVLTRSATRTCTATILLVSPYVPDPQ